MHAKRNVHNPCTALLSSRSSFTFASTASDTLFFAYFSFFLCPAMSSNAEQPPATCPVDHKTRQAWLDKARSQPQTAQPPSPIPAGESCDSTQVSQSPTPTPSFLQTLKPAQFSLDTSREISTIPRAHPTAPANASANSSHSPANNEHESGADKSGNWIYPSQQMFFDAMKRKNFDPQREDMASIVPIHNAVNERAWKEIKEWEKGRGAEA